VKDHSGKKIVWQQDFLMLYSPAEQVAILLDGVPLNRAKSGVVNLSNIPFRNVDRIEVYRGMAPLRFRFSSIGGVINIVTKEPTKGISNQVSATYGSFDTYDLNGMSSGRFEEFGYLLSGNYSASEGDFEFIDDNGTRVNPFDDTKTKRRNNDFRSRNVLGKFSYTPVPSLNLEISNDYFDKQEGIPGISSNQSETANLETVRNILSLKGRKEGLVTENLDGEARFYLLSETSRFQDPFSEIGVGRQDNRNENLGWGLTDTRVISGESIRSFLFSPLFSTSVLTRRTPSHR
jgi:iron complex outermembrane receptor protein